MSINLNDFLGDHPVLLWLALAALLVAARTVVPEPRLVRLALAMLPSALLALLWPGVGWWQAGVAVVLAAVVLLVGRRLDPTPATAG